MAQSTPGHFSHTLLHDKALQKLLSQASVKRKIAVGKSQSSNEGLISSCGYPLNGGGARAEQQL
jgi:hypothetical protein